VSARNPTALDHATVDLTAATLFPAVKRDGIALVDWRASWWCPYHAFALIYAKVAARDTDIVFGKVDADAEGALVSAFPIRSTLR